MFLHGELMALSLAQLFERGIVPSTCWSTCPFIAYDGPCAAINSFDNTYLVLPERNKGDGVVPTQDLPRGTVVAQYTGQLVTRRPRDTRYLMRVPGSGRCTRWIDGHRRTTVDVNGVQLGCHGGCINLAALVNEPDQDEVTNCAFVTLDDRKVLVVTTAEVVFAWQPLLICYYGTVPRSDPDYRHDCKRSRCAQAHDLVQDWADSMQTQDHPYDSD